jgi:hypothetical protein
LVPGAVTEQEAMDLLHKRPARVTELSEGPWFREGLQRIASDRTAGSRDTGGEAVLCLKGTHRWGVSPSATAPSEVWA